MFEECVQVHQHFSCEEYYNPSALSAKSMQISKLLTETEKYFLSRLGASDGSILFTGCATESNNLAIRGSLRAGDFEYVFSQGEHPSVYNVAKKLQLEGYKVHFVPLDMDGKVNLKELEKCLNSKTRLISIMHVSNETGAINDLEQISKLKERLCPRAILHVDGVQAFMKIPFSMRKASVDLYSFSAHKIHGPKGVAGLYVKNKNALKELFSGGGQQYGLRSGTENVSGVMQFRKAVELTNEFENLNRVRELKNAFIAALSKEKGIVVMDFGGSPYILNLRFEGVKGETMLHALEAVGVIIGLGSACSAKKAGNRVLSEIGITQNDIVSSARISFNGYQSVEEIESAAKLIVEVYRDIFARVS